MKQLTVCPYKNQIRPANPNPKNFSFTATSDWLKTPTHPQILVLYAPTFSVIVSVTVNSYLTSD